MIERANCVIALRSEGVSVVLDVSAGQLPAIVHWGADLGTLDQADVAALIISTIDPAARTSSTSRYVSHCCQNTGRAGWVVRA